MRPDPFYKEQNCAGFWISQISWFVCNILILRNNLRYYSKSWWNLPDAYLKASTFTRKGNEIQLSLEKNLKTKLRRNNILLQGGDQVFIASRSQLVTVTGEVNNPGKKLFLKGKRLNYYIKHSGGYTKDADKKAIWVTHVDGNQRGIKGLLSLVKNYMIGKFRN